EFVDKSLRELEQDGQAQKIYDTWFGPQTKTPLARLYKIGDKS
ncbi:amino acid ABC transporter substrate-binding protein, partial [Pseudomonas aeruginosa]